MFECNCCSSVAFRRVHNAGKRLLKSLHLSVHTHETIRANKPNFIKFGIGEFYKTLRKYLIFQLNQKVFNDHFT